MLETLHIEMAFLAAIIDWVKSSGWTYVFERVQIIMVGWTEWFLSGSKVKEVGMSLSVACSSGNDSDNNLWIQNR